MSKGQQPGRTAADQPRPRRLSSRSNAGPYRFSRGSDEWSKSGKLPRPRFPWAATSSLAVMNSLTITTPRPCSTSMTPGQRSPTWISYRRPCSTICKARSTKMAVGHSHPLRGWASAPSTRRAVVHRSATRQERPSFDDLFRPTKSAAGLPEKRKDVLPFSLGNFRGTGGSPVRAGGPPAPRLESRQLQTAVL